MTKPHPIDDPLARAATTAHKLQLVDAWLTAKEDENLEFKEAKGNFHFDKLVKYCAALANEGGGSIVLGVTDRMPRRVVGTSAFPDLERTKAGLVERLRLRIDAEAIAHPHGRVLAITAPSRPIGLPIAVEGAYWMRAGEDLVPMTPDLLQRIFAEAGPDFSAEVCKKATLADLDPEAIELFRARWHQRSQDPGILRPTPDQLLRDAELVGPDGVTFAALVLLGTHQALGRHLAQAETIFEYRSSEAAGPASQREEFRRGFLLWHDRLWSLIDTRNDRQHYQDGLVMIQVPTFNQGAVREAVLNAVAHRDYRSGGSIFVRQFARRLEVVSPGGFPKGIDPENMVDRQLPRNRRIADALARCGLVERAGQGANRMFESCIREGKPRPDFTNTDAWQVAVTLHGQIGDPAFVKFLERIGKETQESFGLFDLLVFDLVRREQKIPGHLAPTGVRLRELGVLESIGRGRGARLLLSQRFYSAAGHSGTHTRRRDLGEVAEKQLLLQHLVAMGPAGSPMAELQEVLPGAARSRLKRLLTAMRTQGQIQLQGARKGARWFAVEPSESATDGARHEPNPSISGAQKQPRKWHK
jgi:ATP-dependent DNA helicase RecG